MSQQGGGGGLFPAPCSFSVVFRVPRTAFEWEVVPSRLLSRPEAALTPPARERAGAGDASRRAAAALGVADIDLVRQSSDGALGSGA